MYGKIQEVRERLEEVSPTLVQYGEAEDANYFKQAQELAQVGYACGLPGILWLILGPTKIETQKLTIA